MPTAWRCVTARTGSISMALTKSGALLEKVGIARYREMFTRLSGKSRERLIQSGIFSEKAKWFSVFNKGTLNILNKKYGITEDDLSSSELEVVPAFKARSLGLDSSMVAAYGQDDKVCAYTSLAAMMTLENVKNTAVCILSDKEEIGSMGNTGMESHMFDFFISEILNKLNVNRPNLLDKVFCN